MIWTPPRKIITSRFKQRGNIVYHTEADPTFGSVVLLMSMDEAPDGAIIITPTVGPTFSRIESGVGNAEISAARSKFAGSQSMLLDDTVGAANARFETAGHFSGASFGSNDFTVEFDFFTPEQNQTGRHIMSSWDDTGDLEWTIQINTNVPGNFNTTFSTSQNGTSSGFAIGQNWGAQHPTGGQLNTWHNVAVSRIADDWYLFADGFELVTANSSVTINTGTVPFRLGGAFTGGGPDFDLSLDNIRFTNGIGRYSGDYTIATEAFPGF